MDLWKLSAGDLARGIARKDFSSAEVVEAHLRRIEAVNPRVNALVRVLSEEARRAGAEADRKVAAGEKLGPLHGVPFTIKENIDVAGTATSWGVPLLAGAVAPIDAPVVERMRRAGAIAIGRTNLPDMGLRLDTDSALYGRTRNPWNPARTAAGSSGGEAAALATGMSPIGLGNDIGGSLRNPASACGVASLRPTQGRVPHAGVVPFENSPLAAQLMHTNGPMARRVADIRLGLSILSGAHPRDPWSLDPPDPPRGAPPPRVAMVAEPPGGPTDPAVAKAARDAGAALAQAGYEVVEAAPPRFDETVETWSKFILGDFSSVRSQIEPLMGEGGAYFFRVSMDAAPPLTATEMSHMFVARQALARAWSLFNRPIEQRLVVVEQIDQIDVTLEVGGLGAELHPHPVQLDVHALGDVGRQADDAARLLFRFGESGGLVERRIVEKVYAALGRSAVAT